jgi:putative SOS response-associated peptidase YedK
MCGRYFLDTLPDVLMRHFGATVPPAYEPHWNIAPTQYAPVLRLHGGARELAMLRWGLIPYWSKDAKIASNCINARGDGVASKPAYRSAFRARRCVVPATGFYEWTGEGKTRAPYAIVPTDGPCFGFAGLWETWNAPDGKVIETYAIVTTEANTAIEHLHHRMPVILDPADYEKWMRASPEAAAALIVACPIGRVRAYPVSKAVNSVKNDEVGLSQPLR